MKAATCGGCSTGFLELLPRSLVLTSTSFEPPRLEEVSIPPVSNQVLAFQCGRRWTGWSRRAWSRGRRGRCRRKSASRAGKTLSRTGWSRGRREVGEGLEELWQPGRDPALGKAASGSGSQTCTCNASRGLSS